MNLKKLITFSLFLILTTAITITNAWSFEKIAVMPVEPVNEGLGEGAEMLDTIITEHFLDSSTVIIITPEQHVALTGHLSGGRLQVIKSVAEKLGSDAILVVTLHQFQQREGSKYSSNSPTSLAFKYHLIRSTDGRAVCTGSYDETQEALTDNILKLKSAFKRGFKWISVEDMAREALKSKFETCPALAQKPAE